MAHSGTSEAKRGTEQLELAIAAFRLALEVFTRQRLPLHWAGTQNNLGLALMSLGAREGRAEWVEEAVKAYHLALEERTRVPLEWAETVYNWARAEWIIADLVSTQAPQRLNRARQLATEALAIFEKAGEESMIRWTKMLLAQIDADEQAASQPR